MRTFAEAIILATKYREDSFDYRKGEDKTLPVASCYNLSLEDAVKKAIKVLGLKKGFFTPIYLLLDNFWSDINQWADSVANCDPEDLIVDYNMLSFKKPQGEKA